MAIENARLFETVKESEVKYRGLFENIQEVVTLNKYLLDEHGEVIDWAYVDANPAALRFLGRSREEVVGRRFSKLVGEEQRDKFLSIARRVRMTNGPMAHESYSEPLDKYALSITAPLTAEMFINTVLDITDIKRAQRRAEESEERFHTMADNISQFAWMANADGERFWFNKRWLEYTGTTLEEMKGWGWLKVHHPENVQGVIERYKKSIEAGEFWEDTYPLSDKDGQDDWFLSRAMPIKDENGNVVRWFGTNTDITEELKIRKNLERSNAELQQFVYVASHDLQEPLRMVTAYLGLLEKKYADQLDGEAKKYMDFAIEGGTRARDLIRRSS